MWYLVWAKAIPLSERRKRLQGRLASHTKWRWGIPPSEILLWWEWVRSSPCCALGTSVPVSKREVAHGVSKTTQAAMHTHIHVLSRTLPSSPTQAWGLEWAKNLSWPYCAADPGWLPRALPWKYSGLKVEYCYNCKHITLSSLISEIVPSFLFVCSLIFCLFLKQTE